MIAQPQLQEMCAYHQARVAALSTKPSLLVLGYRVLYRLVGASNWKTAGETSATTLSYTIAGLTHDAACEVRVVAFNAAGDSLDTSSVEASVDGTVTVALSEAFAATGGSMWLVAIVGIGLIGAGVLVVLRFRS